MLHHIWGRGQCSALPITCPKRQLPKYDRPRYKQLKIMLLKEIPEKYKKYDDYKMLIVDKGYIPNDYKKKFAVSARPILNGLLEKGYKIISGKRYTPYINGQECFAKVLVQKEIEKDLT
ncbi:MAG: hypothetical protein LBH43_21155 [Treponema sp.]|nr:hypothetical protein [Treponema sp.]